MRYFVDLAVVSADPMVTAVARRAHADRQSQTPALEGGRQSFSAPLVGNLGRSHHQGGIRAARGVRVNGVKSDKCLAGAALRNHGGSTGLLPTPN